MKIKAPDWSALTKTGNAAALADGQQMAVTRVMINVSATDLPTIVRIWSLEDTGYRSGPPPKPPGVFTLDVKRGPDRMFQVLAIVETIDTTAIYDGGGDGPVTFYYDDELKSLNRDVEDIPINLEVQGTSSGVETSISGRFIDTNGRGPTGRLNMYYAKPGRPEMIVDSTSVFSGYFDLFLPSGVPFSYRMANGPSLLEGVTTSTLAAMVGQHFMRVDVPQGYNQQDGSRSLRSARTKVLGFIGPGAVGKKVCYSSAQEAIEGLYVSSTIASTDRVSWNPASANSSDARVVGGGIAGAGLTCPGATEEGVDYFSLRVQSLAYGDGPIGIRGPFKELAAGGGSFLSQTLSGANLSLAWKYLPATIGDSVGGVGIFTKALAATESYDRWYDRAPCSKLVSEFGFTEVTRVSSGPQASPLESFTIQNVNLTAYNNGKLAIMICPYSPSGIYHEFALKNETNSSLPGGVQNAIATKLIAQRVLSPNISTEAARTTVAVDACTPIVVRMTDANGSDAMRTGATGSIQAMATVANAPADVKLYGGSDCASGGSSSITAVSSGGNKYIFWVKAQATSTGYDLVVTDTSVGGAALTATTFYATTSSAQVVDKIMNVAPATVAAHQCFSIVYAAGKDVAGEFVPQAADTVPLDFNAAIANNSGLQSYSTPDCTSTVSTTGYSGAQSVREIWFKYTGAAPSISIQPVSALNSTSASSINVVQPGAPTALRVELPSNINASSCQPGKLKSLDSNGNLSPVAAPVTLDFTFNGNVNPPAMGGAFSDAGCTIQVSSVGITSPNVSSAVFYFRWPNQESVAISGTSSNTQTPIVTNVTVGPPI